MNGLPKPAYVMSEPHLSGYRVVLGYETLIEAQDAQAALSQPPQAGTGDALRMDDSAFKIASDLHSAFEQLIYGLPKYLEAENLTDEENMIREAYITLDVTAHRLALLQNKGEG